MIPPYWRLETLGMAGWWVRRHIPVAQLIEILPSVLHLPAERVRWRPDTPPNSWVTEWPESPYPPAWALPYTNPDGSAAPF